MYMNILQISHPGDHGFFSYCSVALLQIVDYYYKNKQLPEYVDMSQIFTMFKINNNDISHVFFKPAMRYGDLSLDDNVQIFTKDLQFENYHNLQIFTKDLQFENYHNLQIFTKDLQFENYHNLQIFTKDLQFENYHNINYSIITPFIKKYFTLSNDIRNIILQIEQKYNIDYENTCCIFYRGNDKSTETTIPSYDTMYEKILSLNISDKKILLQSDETEFFEYFTKKLPNHIIFNDKIKHIRKKKTSINHITDCNTKFILVKNFLAIVYIMSKCKYIVCTSGNISIWITYFRENSNNIYHYLNDKWMNPLI